MKSATLQYKEDMKFPFRNRWLLEVYIGFIQEKYQNSAIASTSQKVSFLSDNYNDYLFKNNFIYGTVATFEKNLFKANGDSIFADEENFSYPNEYYGLISENLSNASNDIDFKIIFKSSRDVKGLKGLTLKFIDTYPTLFNISALENNKEVFNKDYSNDSFTFETIEVFGDNADTLILTIKKMNLPFVRFRLKDVLFGVGVIFNNKDILSSGGNYKEHFHPCSIELPTKDFSLTLDNFEEYYDIDNQESLINLASVGQNLNFSIIYEHFDGTLEQLPSEQLELSKFDINGSSLKLEAIDFLRNENNKVIINDPLLFNENSTLYDMAMLVKNEISNEDLEIVVDDSLKDVPIKYTHIDSSCKEALMMIASAARCIMELRGKQLVIRRISYAKSNLRISSNDAAPYSNINQILNPDESVNISSFEPFYTQANGLSIFPPEEIPEVVKSGYISAALSDEYGSFSNPPTFYIISDEIISTDYLTIRFKDIRVEKVVIETFNNEVPVDKMILSTLDTNILHLSKNFSSFNKMKISIESIHDNNRRVYVEYVSFSKDIYDLNYSLCKEKPHLYVEDNVRNIIVYHSHMGDTEMITESVTIPCNPNGSDIEYNNPFITDSTTAKNVGEWLKEYYATQIFYEIPTVGDPTLQIGDIVKVPNRHNDNILADIETNEIVFQNGGIYGKIETRRRGTDVVRAKNKLGV